MVGSSDTAPGSVAVVGTWDNGLACPSAGEGHNTHKPAQLRRINSVWGEVVGGNGTAETGASFSQKLDSSPRQMRPSFVHLHAAKDPDSANTNEPSGDDRQHGGRQSHAHPVRPIPVSRDREANRRLGNRDVYGGEAGGSIC